MAIQTCPTCKESIFVPRVDVDIAGTREKLRSEFGPSSVGPAEIASVLKNAQKDLDDYQSEIHRLQSQILFLKTQQERLRSHMTQLHYFLSPIRKLPNEMLRHIFDVCVSDYSDFNLAFFEAANASGDERLRHNPAIVMSAVCMQWRRIALSFPSMWSRISLRANTDPDGKPEETSNRAVLRLLQLYLLRSQDTPLTIDICSYDEPVDDHLLPVLALLTQHCARWRSLHVDAAFEPPDFSDHFQEIFEENDFPMLEALSISFADSSHLKALIGKIPKLRRLEMLWGETAVVGFPWDQLEYLACSPYAKEAWEIYSACTNLVSLCVDVAWYEEGVLPNYSYGSVETLSLPCHGDLETPAGSGGLPSALSLLTFPSLKELKIHLIEDMFEPLLSLISRSSCPITTLSLEQMHISDSQLIVLLSLLPTLVDLTLCTAEHLDENEALTTTFIQSLCVGQPRAPLVPKLRSLSINIGTAKTFDDAALVDMIKSRWLPDTRYNSRHEVDCLRSIEAHFPEREEVVDAYGDLDHIERAGMRIAIIWQGVLSLESDSESGDV